MSEQSDVQKQPGHDDTFTSISSLSQQSEKHYEEGDEDYDEDEEEHDEQYEEEEEEENDENLTETEKNEQTLLNRERRTKFNKLQTRVLNEKFRENPYPKEKEIIQMANELDLKHRVVSVWFQNTRQKNRKRTTENSSLNLTNNNPTAEDLDDSQSLTSSTSTQSSQFGAPQMTSNPLVPGTAAMGHVVSNPYQLAMSLLAAAAAQKKQQNTQHNANNTAENQANLAKKFKKKEKEVSVINLVV